jgi:hypothetical protein
VNCSELLDRGQTQRCAAATALDAIPEQDALVAVLVTAEGAPQTPQNQTSALLLPGAPMLAGDVCQTTRHCEAARVTEAYMRTPSQRMFKRWVMPLEGPGRASDVSPQPQSPLGGLSAPAHTLYRSISRAG